jgi:hypothetical protein
MAVVVVMEQKGDTRELVKKYDIVNEHLMKNRPTPPEGLIGHFCIETPTGIRISNVWDTETNAQRGAQDPLLREALTKAQMPQVEPQTLPLHNYFITSELKARV